MAKVVVPAKVATVISAGTIEGLIIGNGGSAPMALNITDPEADGALINLGNKDSVAFVAGSAAAASQWVAYSDLGTVAVVVEL